MANDPRNKRVAQREENFIRGRILDRNGEILAETIESEGGRRRAYPKGPLFAHVIGYVDDVYGKSALEATFDRELQGLSGIRLHTRILDRFLRRPAMGNDLVLTLDARLQEVADEALGDRKGAVIAMNPRSGEILAMVSKPGFNPNTLQRDWEKIVGDENAPLLNRATQGLYPPGSTIKPLVAAAVLESGVVTIADRFFCEGRTIIDGYEISCADGERHGELDLRQAMALSCNVTFASIGARLGEERFYEYARRFRIPVAMALPIPTKGGRLPPGEPGRADLIENSIGQGKMLVTPLHMVLLASTIANDGVMVEPYLVTLIRSKEGRRVRSYPDEVKSERVIPSSVAETVAMMMVEVVRSGTGRGAQIKGVMVAGKTGSAENPGGEAHAWFIGFAPADAPRVAVAVIVENGGYGGVVAAPIGREVMSRALEP